MESRNRINEGQATSFPRTLHTWCEWQTTWIVFINTDTQYLCPSYSASDQHFSTTCLRDMPPMFTTTSHRVKWCVYLPPPPPHFNDAKKKWRVLGFGRKNSSLNRGRVGFVSHFIQTKVVVIEGNLLPFVCLRLEGILRGGGGGGVLKKMFLSDSFGSMRQMISLRGKGAGKMVIIRYPRLLKGSYVWRIRKASK